MLKRVQLIFIIANVAISNWLVCQTVQILTHEYNPDSSLYDICKINENVCWIGGENGVLLQCDSNGSFCNIVNPEAKGEDILKIIDAGSRMIVCCNRRTVFMYSKSNKQFKKYTFAKLNKNACFYDGTLINDSIAILIGGNNKIAQGKVAVAKGFVLKFNLNQPGKYEIITKRSFQFYFTCGNTADSSIVMSSYNGFNSKLFVLKFNNNRLYKINTYPKILFHEIYLCHDGMWLSGSKGMRYRNNSILFNNESNTKIYYENYSIIWSFCSYKQYIIGVMDDGKIIIYDTILKNSYFYQTPIKKPLYEVVLCSEHKILVAGHGKAMLMIDLRAVIKELQFKN